MGSKVKQKNDIRKGLKNKSNDNKTLVNKPGVLIILEVNYRSI